VVSGSCLRFAPAPARLFARSCALHEPQRSRPRSISRPHHARQRLPHSIGHSICSDWQLSRPPSIGRLRRAPVRPLWAPQKSEAERAARSASCSKGNCPPATFHAVQEEQSSCQGKTPCHADRMSFLAHVLNSRVNRSRIIGTLHHRPAACRGRWFRVFPERRWVLWNRSLRSSTRSSVLRVGARSARPAGCAAAALWRGCSRWIRSCRSGSLSRS